MLLRWTTVDAYGRESIRERTDINVKNACTYARKNHRICHGRGYLPFDNGWQYYVVKNNNGNMSLDRKPINPRDVACDCVLRTLEKLKNK